MCNTLDILQLGTRRYRETQQAMQDFTARRDATTPDQLWLLQHPPVYTQGLNGKAEHILQEVDIPIIHSDRGGQITYHGPGQLVMYCLIDLARRGLGVRHLVDALEQSVVSLATALGINASTREDAPGVYVGADKLAALGLRVRRGRSYHGLSLNIDMDLTPFGHIRPCGLEHTGVTQISDFKEKIDYEQITQQLCAGFCRQLGYNATQQQHCEHISLTEVVEQSLVVPTTG